MSVTRRLFLRNSATASAFAFAGVDAAIASSTPDENPALLQAEPLCTDIEARLIRADSARIEARTKYETLAPKLPQSLVLPTSQTYSQIKWCCEQERDPEDHSVYRDGLPSRMIFSSHAIVERFPQVADAPTDDDPIMTAAMRKLYRCARRYEADVTRAKVASGLEDALCRLGDLYAEASQFAYEVVKYDARTWQGVAIKARAIDLVRRYNWDGPKAFGPANHLSASFLLPDVVKMSKGDAS